MSGFVRVLEMEAEARERAHRQAAYRDDCPECHGTGRVERDIGHPGRVARFICFACTGGDADAERPPSPAGTGEPRGRA